MGYKRGRIGTVTQEASSRRSPSPGTLDWEAPIGQFPLPSEPQRLEAEYQDWLARLRLLRGATPQEPYYPSDEALERYLGRLVEIQRTDTAPQLKNGSWALPEDVQMPADARVDFAYKPTLVAMATLALVSEQHPDITGRVPGTDRALESGLRFAMGRGLAGHGYDADRGLLDAVEVLAVGKMFSIAGHQPRRFSPLVRALPKIEARIDAMIQRSSDDWMVTDPAAQQRALILLRGGDAFDCYVLPGIFAEWDACERERYDRAVLEAAVPALVDALEPVIVDQAAELIGELRSRLEEARKDRGEPVFKRKAPSLRVVASEEPVFCASAKEALRQGRAMVAPMPWVEPRGMDEQLKRVAPMLGHLSNGEIEQALGRSGVDANEPFRVHLETLCIDEAGDVYVRIGAER